MIAPNVSYSLGQRLSSLFHRVNPNCPKNMGFAQVYIRACTRAPAHTTRGVKTVGHWGKPSNHLETSKESLPQEFSKPKKSWGNTIQVCKTPRLSLPQELLLTREAHLGRGLFSPPDPAEGEG